MQTYFVGEQASLFAPDTSAGKTFPARSVRERPTEKISGSSWRKLLDYIAPEYQFLDLTPGAGNLLGQSEWEIRSPLHGACWLRNTGVSPRDVIESSLSQILQAHAPKKYYLTTAACRGILRRAAERGKPLPQALDTALRIQAGLTESVETDMSGQAQDICAYHINQRNEGIELGETAGALLATQNVQLQTFVTAAFSAGAGASAGGVSYSEEVAPTLKGSPSGNCMPSVLCLHDQGGRRMDVSENLAGTLLASANSHQPMVYEHHGRDARVRESRAVSPTVTSSFGAGGGNTPLVQENSVYCIVGNIIDRKPENGGNGCGYQEDLAYTLTATDRHSVTQPYQEVIGALCSGDEKGAGAQYVSQNKCIVENTQLIRRLTPLECERLQDFPDTWTDLPSSSDSARYRALGNSVAVPCVEFLMKSLRAVDAETV